MEPTPISAGIISGDRHETSAQRSLRSHASMVATGRPVGRSKLATNRPVGRLADPIPYRTNQSSGKVGAHCIQDGLRLRLPGGLDKTNQAFEGLSDISSWKVTTPGDRHLEGSEPVPCS